MPEDTSLGESEVRIRFGEVVGMLAHYFVCEENGCDCTRDPDRVSVRLARDAKNLLFFDLPGEGRTTEESYMRPYASTVEDKALHATLLAAFEAAPPSAPPEVLHAFRERLHWYLAQQPGDYVARRLDELFTRHRSL